MYKHQALDPLVSKIVTESERLTLDFTVREIADEVKRRTGYKPSTSVIRYSLDRLGIKAVDGKARKWKRVSLNE